jgi:hypothetical protein
MVVLLKNTDQFTIANRIVRRKKTVAKDIPPPRNSSTSIAGRKHPQNRGKTWRKRRDALRTPDAGATDTVRMLPGERARRANSHARHVGKGLFTE